VSTPRAGASRDQLEAMLASSPFHRVLSLSLGEVDTDAQRVVVRSAWNEHVKRGDGADQYHGGVIASLIDIAGDFALIAVFGYGVPTINFRVDYLRPAGAGHLKATATVRRAGRTVGVVDVEVHDDGGRLAALGRGCYGTQAG
jgi:uncharacterized protein (TIGR00369 family)